MSGAVVVVVGSANLDIVTTAPVRPAAGETLLATGFVEVVGGKGANQACAVAHLAPVEFVGSVGEDDAGRSVLAALGSHGVGTRFVSRASGRTGRALITVTPDGENSILVAPLANSRLTADHVARALDEVAPSVVLTQFEIPEDAVRQAWRWCRDHGARLVVNPSPAREVPAEVLEACDPVVVNLGEARVVAGGLDELPDVLAARLARAARSVVITLGAHGAVVAWGEDVVRVDAPQVRARDTTGAGDAFAGALAGHLCAGLDLPTAAHAAAEHAAEVVALRREDR